MPCTVWTFDGESHVVRVDMAATVKDVMQHVIEDLMLSPEAVAARDWVICAVRGTPEDAKHRFGLGALDLPVSPCVASPALC
jgi:hypothetical protein